MGKTNFLKLSLSLKSVLLLILGSTLLYSATINYTTFFGPSLFSPGLLGSKIYKVNFNGPVGGASQINALLNIKDGDGHDIVLDNCGRLQLACLIKNLLKEAEVLLLRPTLVTISINNVVVFSKADYNSKKGVFEKPFVALKNNVMEIKVQGSALSKVTVSAKASSVNLPPVADFTYSATDYIAPATVNFSGLLSHDQDSGYITANEWNFGDGSFGSGSLISHSYANPGNYNVVLTVTDDAGAKASKAQVVVVKANQLPVVRFASIAKTELGDLRVEVDGSGSSDADGTIKSYSINWNDGSAEESTTEVPKFDHVYTVPGQKQITLKALDSKGGVGTLTQSILVQDTTAPVLGISSPEEGSKIRGETVSIYGYSNEKLASAIASIKDSEFPLTISPEGKGFSGTATVNVAGAKILQIKGTDKAGNISVINVKFTTELNKAPIAKLTAPTIVSNGDIATFDASSSKDEDGTIVKYVVNFQDGSNPVEQTTPAFQHSFSQHGYFDVSLQIIDNEGGSATTSVQVYVNAKPTPTFSSSNTENELEINFDASSTKDANENDQLTYSWSFGDGSAGTGINTNHTYSSAGNYTIKLTVSDTYSSNIFVRSIEVKRLEDTPEFEHDRSGGYLALQNEIDKKINSLDTTVVFKLEDAFFKNAPDRQIKVTNNGSSTPYKLSVNGQFLTLEKILIDGKNILAIETLDSLGKTLFVEATIWAGSKTVTVNPITASGEPISDSLTYKVIILDAPAISQTYNSNELINLPNTNIIVTAVDKSNKIGTTFVKEDSNNINLVIRSVESLSSNENNDFSQSLKDWTVENATAERIVDESVPTLKYNMQATSNSSFRISKTIMPEVNTKNISISFQIEGYDPEDTYVVVFRDELNNKTQIETGNLRLHGLSEITNELFQTRWIEISHNSENFSGPIEVSLHVFTSNSLTENKGNSFSNLLMRQLISPAYAESEKKKATAKIRGIKDLPFCLNNLSFIDYVPDPATLPIPSKKVPSEPNLKSFSIGNIPETYNHGTNEIAIRFMICKDNAIKRLDLEAVIKGKHVLLGSTTEIIALDDNFYDAKFALDGFLGGAQATLVKLESELKSESSIFLNVRARDKIPPANSPLNFSEGVTFGQAFPILKRDGTIDERYRTKDSRDDDTVKFDDKNLKRVGGDDWAQPWLLSFLKDTILPQYKFLLKFNDISNMNGGYFQPHTGHQLGQNIDFELVDIIDKSHSSSVSKNQLKIANSLIDFFTKYSPRITTMYITHTRPGFVEEIENPTYDEFEDLEFDPKSIIWNRLRHECIQNRLVRRIIQNADLHNHHFHAEFSGFPLNKYPNIGTVDINVSVKPGGILEFNKDLFEFDVNGIQYEAYIEKTINGEKEFVPVKSGVNPIGGFGIAKLKLLKIQKLYDQNYKKNSKTYYACSTNTTAKEIEQAKKPAKYVNIHITPNGLCGGAPLNLSRVSLDYPSPEEEIGWVSTEADVKNSNIGSGAYICPNSIVENSEIIGGLSGLVTVSSSKISGGSLIYGNYQIEHSNIDHADIEDKPLAIEWSFEDKFNTISYSDISDLTNSPIAEENGPPIQLFGTINLLGTSTKRTSVSMTTSPINVGMLSIVGPQLFGNAQPITLSSGAKVKNAIVGNADPVIFLGVPINISEDSVVDQSFIYGNVSLSAGAKIESSQVGTYPESSAVVLERKPASNTSTLKYSSSLESPRMKIDISGVSISSNSNIAGYGTISGKDVKIKNSTLSDLMNISGKTNIENSIIKSSTISDATIETEAFVEYSIISGNSTVTNGQLSGATLTNKAKVENSGVTLGTIDDSEVTNGSSILESSILNKSKINNSGVSNSSTIDNSEIALGSFVYGNTTISDDSHIYSGWVSDSATVSNSKLNGSSYVMQSSVTDSTLNDSQAVYSSTLHDVTLTNNSVIQGSEVYNSHNIDNSRISEGSKVTNSSITGYSEVINSTVTDSTVDNSSVRYSKVIEQSTIRNVSSVDHATIKRKSSLNQANFSGSTCDHSLLISTGIIFTPVKDSAISESSISNSSVDISFIGGVYNAEKISVYDSTLNPFKSYLYDRDFYKQNCNQVTDEKTHSIEYECVAGSGPTISTP